MKPLLGIVCVAFVSFSLGVVSSASAQPLFSLADAGTTAFGDWSFSWTVNGHDEGLSLTNVLWKGTKVLYKASLPVIRVKYRGDESGLSAGCGPYADRLGGFKTDKFRGVPHGVNVVARLWDGQLFELGVYDEIGGYELYQAWYFHTSGWMEGMLFSRGWSCGDKPVSRRDHRHHPYWRFDFDVESVNNWLQIFRTPASGPSTFFNVFREGDASRIAGNPNYGARVTSGNSSKYVDVFIEGNELPDESDRPWFGFSYEDLGWRLYRGSEDDGWPFGSLGQLGFDDPLETSTNRDVVLWLVAHMSHTAYPDDPKGQIWHAKGPTIYPSW